MKHKVVFLGILVILAQISYSGPIGFKGLNDLHEKIDNFIRNNRIALFSATYCPYAKYVKTQLNNITADYKVFEVDAQQLANGRKISQEYPREYLQKITGERTVPQLFLNGVFLGQSSFVKELVKNGTLEDVLLE